MIKDRKKLITGIICVIILGIIFMLYNSGIIGGKTMIVGKNISQEDITDFYFTYDSSTNPPYFQRYRLYLEEGKHYFYHEKREGDHWPLTESDVTISGKKELSEEEWENFYELLEGGTVEKRKEHLESGGRGPWLFIYWKKDKGRFQEYSFESYDKQLEFEKYCKKTAE